MNSVANSQLGSLLPHSARLYHCVPEDMQGQVIEATLEAVMSQGNCRGTESRRGDFVGLRGRVLRRPWKVSNAERGRPNDRKEQALTPLAQSMTGVDDAR
jgi:hypothetical protein